MAKNRNSPGNRSPSDALDDLLAAIGKADANNFERHALESELLEIADAWSARRGMPSAGSYQKQLRRFRENTAKRRELRRQLRPLREAIVMAGWLRQNPRVDENRLRASKQDHPENIDLAEIEEREDQDIAFLIDRSGDYRKRQVRKLAVEPFLRLLEKYDVVPQPKLLPRNRMMQAFFDWLGIERKLRPSDVGIRTVARDLKKRPPK